MLAGLISKANSEHKTNLKIENGSALISGLNTAN